MPDTSSPPTTPRLSWDWGGAYELFISLHVLHQPGPYGQKASWAAGIRSRIPAPERKFLEEVIPFIGFPIRWVHRLAAPKDAVSVLYALRQIPAERRLAELIDLDHWEPGPICDCYRRVMESGAWTAQDLAFLQSEMKEKPAEIEKVMTGFLGWWVRPAEAGEMLLRALTAYQQVFFEEEEKRVTPVLLAGLERAQALAGRMNLPELMVELSQGVQFENVASGELVLVPAYWTTPLVLLETIGEGRMLFLFGARPATMSATPGELVPDGLLRSLKALSDSTRLKILYYLGREQLTPSELARRLHLRAPTVTHHLGELRLAGLVSLTVRGQEKYYTARREALQQACGSLKEFLESEPS